MTYPESIQYLNSLINFETQLHALDQQDFSLQRFKEFCTDIGDPQRSLKCVHIAGSKGKGSTAAMTAEILKAAGYRVGLYTSPHLYDVRERIRVLTQDAPQQTADLFPDCISPQDFARWTAQLKQVQGTRDRSKPLTYYEFLTVLAFVCFREQRVDIAVLETGLGGRLDATNVVKPFVCAITKIDLEHTNILGETLEQIAAEKAGIIKPGCVGVVAAPQQELVEQRIRNVCVQHRVSLVIAGPESCPEGPALLGDFQKENAALAVQIVACLKDAGFRMPPDAIAKGMRQAFWPARLEIVSQDPLIVIDGAHTPAASQALSAAITSQFPGKKVVLVFGISRGKDKEAVVQHLLALANRVILTKSSHERADERLQDDAGGIAGRRAIPAVWRPVLEDAIDEALANVSGNDMIIVAGSLFVAAEVRLILLEREKAKKGKRETEKGRMK